MSTTTKFTPGPWKVFRTTDGRSILGVGDKSAGGITDGGDVSSNDLGIWRSGAEREANARLIAAAPELYEELERVAKTAAALGLASMAATANAALAKARGEG